LDAVTTLLSQLSIEGIILVIVLFAAAVKFLGELFEYLYNKLKKYFDIKGSKEKQYEEIMNKLNALETRSAKQEERSEYRQAQIDKISKQLDKQDKQSADFRQTIEKQTQELSSLKSQISTLTERTQDSTRAYLIDKHHYFCYQIGSIDDMSLQDMERRFMYYKAAGGDTFIDDLMEEIRALPRLTLEHMSGQIRKEN
jgi:predicted nuclease with TOPRIM domain